MPKLKVTLGNVAAFALSLDDVAMLHELHLVEVPSRKGTTALEGEPAHIATVLDSLLSRSTPAGGWDQPATWMRACRAGWQAAKGQVEAQGYRVRVGTYGRVSLVAK